MSVLSIDLGTIYTTIPTTMLVGEIESVYRLVKTSKGFDTFLSTVITSVYPSPKPVAETKPEKELEERIRRLVRRIPA